MITTHTFTMHIAAFHVWREPVGNRMIASVRSEKKKKKRRYRSRREQRTNKGEG